MWVFFYFIEIIQICLILRLPPPLDLDLFITDGILSSKIYGKQDGFIFNKLIS